MNDDGDLVDGLEPVDEVDGDDDRGVACAGPGAQRLSPCPLGCSRNLELPPSK